MVGMMKMMGQGAAAWRLIKAARCSIIEALTFRLASGQRSRPSDLSSCRSTLLHFFRVS